MSTFEFLEHTADIGFRVNANSLPELFEGAAEALVSTVMETGNIEGAESYPLAAEGDSQESVLVNWLSDVLYNLDGRRLALRDFKFMNSQRTGFQDRRKENLATGSVIQES